MEKDSENGNKFFIGFLIKRIFFLTKYPILLPNFSIFIVPWSYLVGMIYHVDRITIYWWKKEAKKQNCNTTHLGPQTYVLSRVRHIIFDRNEMWLNVLKSANTYGTSYWTAWDWGCSFRMGLMPADEFGDWTEPRFQTSLPHEYDTWKRKQHCWRYVLVSIYQSNIFQFDVLHQTIQLNPKTQKPKT